MIRKTVAVLAAPVACTIIVGCSAEAPASDSAPHQHTTTTAAPAGKSKPPSSPAAKPEAAPQEYAQPDAHVSIVVRDGEVFVGKSTVAAKLGDHVIVKVMSDRADELHLHGYDLTEDLEPGKPATLSFTADIPGQFEAELHHLHLRLFRLQVQ